MKKASLTEAGSNLGKPIDGLASGTSVPIADRGGPGARFEPITSAEDPDDGRLARLVRSGIVRSESGKPALAVLASPPPQVKRGASAVKTLMDERREGR